MRKNNTAPKKEVVIDPEKANGALKGKDASKGAAKAPKDDVVDVKATEIKEEAEPEKKRFQRNKAF